MINSPHPEHLVNPARQLMAHGVSFHGHRTGPGSVRSIHDMSKKNNQPILMKIPVEDVSTEICFADDDVILSHFWDHMF